MASNARWGSVRSGIAWRKWPWCWSWSRSSRPTWSRSNTPTGPTAAPWTLFNRSTGWSTRDTPRSSTPTCRVTSRRHLDALLKTQGVELPRPELSEPVESLGGVREQIQLSSGVERDLDRAVVDAIVDPAPFEIQPLDELRHRQETGDLPRVRLLAVAEQAVAEPDESHRAGQDGRVSWRVVTTIGQASGDLFIRSPLPRHHEDRLLDLPATREERPGADGDRDVGGRRLAPLPDHAAVDGVRGDPMDDHLVDQAPEQRLLLLLREPVGPPPLRDPSAGLGERPPGLGVELRCC